MQPTPTPQAELLTTGEAATALRVSAFTVRRLVEQGVLPVVRYSARGRFRFRREDVERLKRPRVGGGDS